jgi:hypothetical protein
MGCGNSKDKQNIWHKLAHYMVTLEERTKDMRSLDEDSEEYLDDALTIAHNAVIQSNSRLHDIAYERLESARQKLFPAANRGATRPGRPPNGDPSYVDR